MQKRNGITINYKPATITPGPKPYSSLYAIRALICWNCCQIEWAPDSGHVLTAMHKRGIVQVFHHRISLQLEGDYPTSLLVGLVST